ncbi:MAG: hypothetical protein QNJ44_01575 [Rhodobacter sp.]|nr:hypothetical protein [Rhodobacter sp.]
MTERSLTERLRDVLPGLPELGREVEIPVYVVHNSADPEDYFFLFDFELFVERSRQGLFPRPRLRVRAGRDDFSRLDFAAEFRRTFALEFDRMREELNRVRKDGRGWLSWDLVLSGPVQLAGSVLAHVVLYVAVSAGRGVLSSLGLRDLFRGKSDAARLEERIEGLQGKVDAALSRVEIRLHEELFAHAFPDGLGKRAGIDYGAWPLPGYVRAHLRDGQSGSWW